MERHIGVWHKETDPNVSNVGELLIEGNHIEFYSRHESTISQEAFVGKDDRFVFKIIVDGPANPGQNRVLDYSNAHNVCFALMQRDAFSIGTTIAGIKEFSFEIPQLIQWLGYPTVYFGSVAQNEPVAGEYPLGPITIKENNPSIELYFESQTLENSFSTQDTTAITIKKVPRIRVVYEQPTNIQTVYSDIECLMQFWGLLIGKVSVAEDIRLTIEGQSSKCWLFINHDFSYNMMSPSLFDSPHTYHYVLEDNLSMYYSNWFEFFHDHQYRLLRRLYFSVNTKKDIYLEEKFVEYVKFLDGYHTRAFGDAETQCKLKAALKAAQKKIKELLFTDENKPLFEEAVQSVIPDWRFNSSNVGEISEWIATGYVARKPLSHRLKELDINHFEIIGNNAEKIDRLEHSVEKSHMPDIGTLKELYYKKLSDTRNYYSHNKQDETNILTYTQIIWSNKVLKALIISIFMDHMGIDSENVRRILAFDSELRFQTGFLRKPEETPFIHPIDMIRMNSTKRSDN